MNVKGKVNFFSHAFDRTLRRYRITAKSIAQETGMSQAHLSAFRNGENLSVEALSAILQVMENTNPGSIKYFLQQVEQTANSQPSPSKSQSNMEKLIANATDDEFEDLMLAIAQRWRERNNGDSVAALRVKN